MYVYMCSVHMMICLTSSAMSHWYVYTNKLVLHDGMHYLYVKIYMQVFHVGMHSVRGQLVTASHWLVDYSVESWTTSTHLFLFPTSLQVVICPVQCFESTVEFKSIKLELTFHQNRLRIYHFFSIPLVLLCTLFPNDL